MLGRALDPSPAQRFQTVAEFAAALVPTGGRGGGGPDSHVPARAGGRRALALTAMAAVLGGAVAVWLLWGGQRPPCQCTATRRAGGLRVRGGPSSTACPPHPIGSPLTLGRRPKARSVPALPPPGRAIGERSAESLLVDVRSVDSTIQVDLRYATANNFTGAPLPGYEAPRALLRREAAAALGRVQARLRADGLGLRIFDAYRPVRATIAMVDWAERSG